MESRLVVLKLFLNELGQPSDITTVYERKRVQKAVYLGQLSGVDIGYRFGWYLMGPYSTSLTRDYYSLSEALDAGDSSYNKRVFNADIKSKLNQMLPVLQKPKDINLSEDDWLELLASWHYLLKVSKYPKQKAIEEFRQSKENLLPYIDEANKHLEAHKLL